MIVWGGVPTTGSGGYYLPQASGDADLDDFCSYADCDDTNDEIWATPGEVAELIFTDKQTLSWTVPLDAGGVSVVYDTLRSENPTDFVGAGACVESNDGADHQATDAVSPNSGGVFYYLVRANNDCPLGHGSLGAASGGQLRIGRTCP